MKVLLSHPTGNRNVRAVLQALAKDDSLEAYLSSVAISGEAKFLRFLPERIRKKIARRTFDLAAQKIHNFPLREIARNLALACGFGSLHNREESIASTYQVYRALDKAVARSIKNFAGVDTLYCYEDGALESFKEANRLGLKKVYDLPIAFWETGRRLMEEEALRLPEWALTLGTGISDSREKLERKNQELDLADLIVTPSSFVQDSLPKWAAEKKVICVPFGSPLISRTISRGFRVSEKKRKLRVLFVGSLGQRKGLADLFEAVRMVGSDKIELVILGSPIVPLSFYREQLLEFTFEAGRPHSEVLELMRSCDIFCLPSIVEGRALVIQEAMSQGLPVIITPNTGGSDLAIDFDTGFLVPIRSPEIIASRIQWFVDNDFEIERMGKAAQAHALNYSWAAYGDRIFEAIDLI